MSVFLCNLLWLLSCLPGWLLFQLALRRPAVFQRRRLRRILRANRDTEWGRRHAFAEIRSWAEWQQRPTTCYTDYAEALRRIGEGASAVLTAAPVVRFEPTSGSGGTTKLIPVTAPLRTEMQAALAPWMASLYLRRPRLLGGRHYWSISPATPCPTPPGCRVPVGFEADAEYLGALQRRLAARLFVAPSQLRLVQDQTAWEFLTLVFLLRETNLRLISVWHPSFLTLLLKTAHRDAAALADVVRNGRLPDALVLSPDLRAWFEARMRRDPRRADALERLLAQGEAGWAGLWPRLQVISCWDQGRAAAEAADLRRLFPKVWVQGKGLLATEGVISIPGGDGAAVAAATAHVLEFEDSATGLVLGLEELRTGREYAVLLTTGGGLYRYRLGDRVRCIGFRHRTPVLEFVARLGVACDLVGEKLTAELAEQALRRLEADGRLAFAMFAPEADGHGYALYLEEAARRAPAELQHAVETALGESYHYAHARRLGQLRPVRIRPVTEGMARYRAELVRRGMKTGDIKAVPLHEGDFWECVFWEPNTKRGVL